MSFHWINPADISINCILLMDRRLVGQVCGPWYGEEYSQSLAIVLANHPAVAWYCKEKAPETAAYVDALLTSALQNVPAEEIRAAECFVLDQIDWAVVYVYPELMEQNCPYIYAWDKARLFELADLSGKLVLDVGAGTGRLTFAAAGQARHVYASEPVDRLREFMRAKIQREAISNVTVLDGMCDCLPYEDSTFDVVMSGHVVGDDYDRELAELERITKPRGWILDCPGEDDRWTEPEPEMLSRGFECLPYESKTGGKVCRYRKQIVK